jgi:DNA-binding MarR family transcriptional regulator
MLSDRQKSELKLLQTKPQSPYDVFKKLDVIVSRADVSKDLAALEREGYIRNTVCIFKPRRAKILKITTKGKTLLDGKC